MAVPVKSGLFVADVMIPIADGLLIPHCGRECGRESTGIVEEVVN
ncbi:hypothetical protein [Endozoicomonas sp. SESOKO1]|nr:hypothetical protein [Endozoicomonas sp. SESOKO1]